MYGIGILKGMAVTIKHFWDSYVDDFYWAGRGGRYYNDDALLVRQGLKGRGVKTVFYPEEKLDVPERFRFVPFLITDDPLPGQKWGKDRCTACGICAKVCPPQCIWIERGKKPNGRPKPEPKTFFIDIDICMNCGFCMEFCPFDAIKLDHDYELASYDRTTAHIHDKERLSKPISYWHEIAPQKAAAEEAARNFAQEAKAKKKAKKGSGSDEPDPTLAEEHARQLLYRGGSY
ncbi:MAG: 4Fe-4S dicluster domain-containing protein [Chloroflexi bacterium]|nr:4Fe-4S dicluster domain-containing protein [Chloroflexota bacterium]